MDELQISGKRFISSRRIAKENGYTSDYVGQLIRGGKVLGQKVGRAWYVDAASFDAYLGGGAAVIAPTVMATEEPVPETTVAVPPAEVVEEKVFEEKIVEPVAEAERVVEPEPEPEPVHTIPLRVSMPAAEIKVPAPVKVSGLRYYQEDGPALPEIRPADKESRLPKLTVMSEHTPVSIEERTAFAPGTKRRMRPVGVLALAGVGVAVFTFSAWLSSAVSLNLSITEGNSATATYGINK